MLSNPHIKKLSLSVTSMGWYAGLYGINRINVNIDCG